MCRSDKSAGTCGTFHSSMAVQRAHSRPAERLCCHWHHAHPQNLLYTAVLLVLAASFLIHSFHVLPRPGFIGTHLHQNIFPSTYCIAWKATMDDDNTLIPSTNHLSFNFLLQFLNVTNHRVATSVF